MLQSCVVYGLGYFFFRYISDFDHQMSKKWTSKGEIFFQWKKDELLIV